MEALPNAISSSIETSIISALFSDALFFAHGLDVAPALHGVVTQLDRIVKFSPETRKSGQWLCLGIGGVVKGERGFTQRATRQSSFMCRISQCAFWRSSMLPRSSSVRSQ